jgi:PleD family two-component response regulator
LLTFPNLQQRANFRTAIGGAIVTRAATEFWILAVVPTYRRAEIAHQLAPLNANLLFVRHFAEASAAIRENDVFQVALLPASLTDTDWWELWGVLALLDARPAILVYAREATFQLWSGVLELGGYDVIVEPFSGSDLQDAVLRAAKSFEQRPADGRAQK